jgi:hypothetical protein
MTLCEDCDNLHSDRGKNPKYWMCVKFPRLEYNNFVTKLTGVNAPCINQRKKDKMEDFSREVKLCDQNYFGTRGCFLAGGAITSIFTNKPINDYDLYFKSEKDFCNAVFDAFDQGWFCLAQTERAITFSDNGTIVQMMSFDWFPTAQDIFNKYDFTCCMGAIDLETKEFFRHKEFLTDCSKRILNFNCGTEFPIASAMRVKKYKEKGFDIEPSEYLKILISIAFKQINNWDELSNQIGGQYGQALKIDKDIDFNLNNAVSEFEKRLNVNKFEIETPLLEGAASFFQAMEKIFGKEKAEQIEKEMEIL